MQLRIRAQNIDLPFETRHTIERRLRLVVGRHAAGIARLQLTLSARREPTDADGSHCRIRVDLRHGATLTVEGTASDPSEAAAAAAWKLQHRLHQPLAGRNPARRNTAS